jgi:adenylate cyclase
LITDKRQNLKIITLLLIISLITANLCFLLLPTLFETWNLKAKDLLYHFRSSYEHLQPTYDDTIVHVDLTDTSIERLDHFYLNRYQHAQVIRNLKAMDVSIQMYDFIFAARTNEDEDRAIMGAVKNAGNVYFGMAFRLSPHNEPQKRGPKRSVESEKYLMETKWQVTLDGDPRDFYIGTDPIVTFPDLASISQGLGYLSLKLDRDGVFRRLPLLIKYSDGFYPSFAFRGICDYLGVPPENVVVKPGVSIVLKGARRPGEGEAHDIVIPIDRYGNMIINFVGPWERMKHYNFVDILRASEDRDEMEMWAEELSGKIVVLSEVMTGSSDPGPVPTDANFPLSGLHANVINTILTESFLHEPTDLQMFAIEVFLLIFIGALSIILSSIPFSIGGVGLIAAYVASSTALFLYGNIILNMVRPLFMMLFSVFSIMVYRYWRESKERNFIRYTFGRYLSKEVVKELLDSPDGLQMKGELREVTFLVSDLRGFTGLSSQLLPQEVIDIINRYLKCMVDIITRYRGTVNEIEGDGILTFFGAPVGARDDHERAVACAIEMQNAMKAFNKEQERLSLPELCMGIGINSGDVVVGNIGSEKRAKYCAIGNAINMAYRIESYTTGGQILISPSTFERNRDMVRIKSTMEVQFKGIDQPVTLYDVAGMEGAYQLFLPVEDRSSMVKVDPPVNLQCFRIEDKVVSRRSISGHLIGLSTSSAEILFNHEVALHSNFKILLDLGSEKNIPEVYAKVLSQEALEQSPSGGKAHMEFTWLPEDVKSIFKKKWLKDI